MNQTITKYAQTLGIEEIQGWFKGDICIAIKRNGKLTIFPTQEKDVAIFYSLLLEPMGIICYVDSSSGDTCLMFEDGVKKVIDTSFTWVVK